MPVVYLQKQILAIVDIHAVCWSNRYYFATKPITPCIERGFCCAKGVRPTLEMAIYNRARGSGGLLRKTRTAPHKRCRAGRL